jgi:hypothetical protein
MNMQHQFREAKNPMFNDNKLKLGTFGTIAPMPAP